VPKRIIQVIEAVTKLSNVGGNHARFLYDFSPESAIFRWTHHPVPQFLYCFEQPEADTLTAPRLKQLIECEEIPAKEIWIFGGYAFTEEAVALEKLGVNLYPSIWKGVRALTAQIIADLEISDELPQARVG
jgi:CRISPR-associated protein Cst2